MRSHCICGDYVRREIYTNGGIECTEKMSICKNCGRHPPRRPEPDNILAPPKQDSSKVLDEVPADHVGSDLWVVTELPDNPGVIVPIRKYISLYETENKTVWVKIPFIPYDDL